MPRIAEPFRLIVVLVLGALAASVGSFAVASEDAADARVALELTRPPRHVSPGQPVLVRFAVINRSTEAVTLCQADAGEPDAGLRLPLSFVLGSDGNSALTLRFMDETPTPVRPASIPAAQGGSVRLAPGGSLGLEVDLRQIAGELRYAGDYFLEWRPAGGAFGSATLAIRIEPRRVAVLTTDYGSITFTLNYDGAPLNVENFCELVRDRFYDGRTFHRLVPGYLIQGGRGPGVGGAIRPDNKRVVAEFSQTPFEAGTLAMARIPNDPDSASCQFFICLDRRPDLDGQYSIIGWARDDASLRTLRMLSELPVDGEFRPLRPLVIQSLGLHAEEGSTGKRDLGRPGSP